MHINKNYSFEIRSSQTGRPETRPTRNETGPGWKKNKEMKNLVWPDWPGRLTQWSGCNSLTFIFLLKQYRFDFLIDPNNLVKI